MFEGIWERSKTCLIIIGVCLTFQIVAVETFGDFMDVKRLPLKQWIVSIILAALTLAVGAASRFIKVQEPVFPKVFSEDNCDEDAKGYLLKLTEDVERTAAERALESGESPLEVASHARVLGLWRRAQAHHVDARRVVTAFRRARRDGDMQSPVGRQVYSKMRENYGHVVQDTSVHPA
ncbi:Cation transporting ATPase, C-terminus, putative [Angomonas deanei]|uniref:Cation transporting ATPase, C-terminus, putative n=1 Tax=Angomonas deanei TaxID=59799 RepID=A0A7G2CSV0_9TRYP|nr:Cation transporting ATPase, C-terminus, putative [Angomonas deanei]